MLVLTELGCLLLCSFKDRVDVRYRVAILDETDEELLGLLLIVEKRRWRQRMCPKIRPLTLPGGWAEWDGMNKYRFCSLRLRW